MTDNISGGWRTPRGAVTTDREITSVSEDGEEDSLPSVIVGATLSVLRGSEVGQLRYVDAGGASVGRDESSKLRFSAPTVSRSHATLVLKNNAFQVADLDSANGTFVDEMGSQAFERLPRALFMDPLTGSGNRTFLDLRMREEISFGRRHGQTIAVMLADLDHFKQINDRFGHVVGDRFLKRIGQILADVVRVEDSVYRYGGEEFCVLVRGIGHDGLVRMAERIRVAIEAFEMPVSDEVAKLTVSLGIASLVPGEDEPEGSTLVADMKDEPADVASQLIRRADAALYLAKGRGRNCIEVYSEDAR